MTSTATAEDLTRRSSYQNAVRRLKDARVVLPTFAELADPSRIPARVRAALGTVDPDAAHPLNLFRVHWWNDASRRGIAAVPEHVVLTKAFTGIDAPIVVALGNRFPMIHAHKVLAAYSCLVPRLVRGEFDPGTQRAIWPSTGNYCRGGIAISRLLGCRGAAVLPEGMSAERFRWLEQWVSDPSDIVRTPGSESNVKEIYDQCAELERDPANVILNQFSEFGNHLGHVVATGSALEAVYQHLHRERPALKLAAFVSATGSAGTIAAGDPLKEAHGAKIVAVEALECPTMLENGFGEHNIQGIGDKHMPLIHNVMNTDVVVGVSDHATDQLGLVCSSHDGRSWLREVQHVPEATIEALASFGLSSLCNIVAAVKAARALGLGPDDAVFTIATDGDAMYSSEHELARRKYYPAGFARGDAATAFERWMLGADTANTEVLDDHGRRRIFNLGYFTWVEQRGVSLEAFVARRDLGWWRGLRTDVPKWDAMITEMNERTGVLGTL
ncbi:MAG: pyridoxal-phosphate dependent enzyme [Candidatus Eisenbacteria bacterium]